MRLGGKHVEFPFIELGQLSTVLYFSHFLFIIPVISLMDNTLVFLSIIHVPREVLYNVDSHPTIPKGIRLFHSIIPKGY